MKNRILAILAVCAAAFLVQGCGETNARYVESGGTRSLISTKKVNIADWNSAASALVDDMLASGVLDRYEKPVVMKVSRIVNRTSEAIDTDLLTKQISITLNKSGNVLTMSEDEYTKDLAQAQAFENGGVPTPKITMSGKIVEDRESIGDTNEVTYVFMLSINSSNGLALWEGQKQITKQQEKSGWGW